MPSICISTASAVTGLTKRTLWRYMKDGRLTPLGETSQGNRTRVALEEVMKLCTDPLDKPDEQMVLAADAGDCEAQCDVGIWMLERDHPSIARDWFMSAARAGNPDAMCYLGCDLLLGMGGGRNEVEGMRWLHQAAALEQPLPIALLEALHHPTGIKVRAANDVQALQELIDKVERKVLLDALTNTAI